MSGTSLRELLERLARVPVARAAGVPLDGGSRDADTVAVGGLPAMPTVSVEDLPPSPAVTGAVADGALPPRYRLELLLGQGGMGEVWRARDEILGRSVALKFLHARLAHVPEVAERFLQEARAGAALQHPNVIPLYDVGRLGDGRPFFTMREVHGTTFTDRIRERHPAGHGGSPAFTWVHRRLGELLRVFLRVCETVAYAHSVGFIHRDLKPENIMVGEFGEVLVLDWGLSKRLGTPDRSHDGPASLEPAPMRSMVGAAKGTPAYMAPEQISADGTDGRATDVYALGGILHELLTGAAPFSGWSTADILQHKAGGGALPALPGALLEVDISVLVRLRNDALRPRIEERTSVDALAAGVRDWLSGSDRAVRARQRTREAAEDAAAAATLRARAEALRDAAARTWEADGRLEDTWATWQDAAALEEQGLENDAREHAALRDAVQHDPSLEEQRERLAWLEARAVLSAVLSADPGAERRHRDALERSLECLESRRTAGLRASLDAWLHDGLMARLARTTPYVPRVGVSRSIADALAVGGARVQLTGPAGSGRRRAALEHARSRSLEGHPVLVLDIGPGSTEREMLGAIDRRRAREPSAAEALLLVVLGEPGCEMLISTVLDSTGGNDDLSCLVAGVRESIPGLEGIALGPLPLPAAVQLFQERARMHGTAVPETATALGSIGEVVEACGRLPLLIELAADQHRSTPLDGLAAALASPSGGGSRGVDADADVRRVSRLRWEALPEWARDALVRLSVARGPLPREGIEALLDVDLPDAPLVSERRRQLVAWFLLDDEQDSEGRSIHALSPSARLLCSVVLARPTERTETLRRGGLERLGELLHEAFLHELDRMTPTDVERHAGVHRDNLRVLAAHGLPHHAGAAVRALARWLVAQGSLEAAVSLLEHTNRRDDLDVLDRRRLLLLQSGLLGDLGRRTEAHDRIATARRLAGGPVAAASEGTQREVSATGPDARGSVALALRPEVESLLRGGQAEAALTRVESDLVAMRDGSTGAPAAEVGLLFELARCQCEVGALDGCLETLLELEARTVEAGRKTRWRLEIQRAWLDCHRGDLDGAGPRFREALADTPSGVEVDLLVWAHEGHARCLEAAGLDDRIRQEGFLHVLRGTATYDAQRLAANHGLRLLMTGRPADAYAVLSEVLARMAGLMDGVPSALIHTNLAWACMALGRWDEADDASRQGLRRLEVDRMGFRSYLRGVRALILALAGREGGARRLLASDAFRKPPSGPLPAVAMLVASVARWLLGETDAPHAAVARVPTGLRDVSVVASWIARVEALAAAGVLLDFSDQPIAPQADPEDIAGSPMQEEIRLEAQRWHSLGEVDRHDGRRTSARAAYRQARLRAQVAGAPVAMGRAEWALGLVAENLEGSARHLTRAIALLERAGQTDRVLSAKFALAGVYGDQGRLRQAKELMLSMLDGPPSVLLDRGVQGLRRLSSINHVRLGLGEDILDDAVASLERSRETGDVRSISVAQANVALAHWMAGQGDAAHDAALSAVRRIEGDGLQALRCELHLLVGRLSRMRGDLVEASIQYRRAAELAVGQAGVEPSVDAGLAVLAARRGDIDRAGAWLRSRPDPTALSWPVAASVIAGWLECAALLGEWGELDAIVAADAAVWASSDVSPASPERRFISWAAREALAVAEGAGVSVDLSGLHSL